ncbi:hypothetical protein [Nocardia colli]|uniref:hypothetical protein n=1 Tax=Nocardia colli TaxID=2545717 RepID=UPI0035D7AC69
MQNGCMRILIAGAIAVTIAGRASATAAATRSDTESAYAQLVSPVDLPDSGSAEGFRDALAGVAFFGVVALCLIRILSDDQCRLF